MSVGFIRMFIYSAPPKTKYMLLEMQRRVFYRVQSMQTDCSISSVTVTQVCLQRERPDRVWAQTSVCLPTDVCFFLTIWIIIISQPN